MGELAFLDHRQVLLTELDTLRKEVESGSIIGIAWVSVGKDITVTSSYCIKSDVEFGYYIMRGAVAQLAHAIDTDEDE